MTLAKDVLEKLAARLEDAYQNRKAIAKITDEYPDLTLEEAYAIQCLLRERKIAQGHKIVGQKMG
jgi:2-oxo-3-hexenedioate decarboxylase